ncbi:MAG: hypothetical protein P1U57_00605 [Oleibacter sp.]|nr:hypothetical protein [Thalassolituus sp.]
MKTQPKARTHLGIKTFLFGVLVSCATPYAVAETPAKQDLQPVSAFADIKNEVTRSQSIFVEMGKVIQHPRCVNCHPKGDSPLQGMLMQPHQPPVMRGPGGTGMPGMQCKTCHLSENVDVVAQAADIKSIPGDPAWHLAPTSMAWEGKSLSDICAQIKDKKRNGGKTLQELKHHMSKDTLVGWGWEPGEGRIPAPGSQEAFGQLYVAWVASGAHCPK